MKKNFRTIIWFSMTMQFYAHTFSETGSKSENFIFRFLLKCYIKMSLICSNLVHGFIGDDNAYLSIFRGLPPQGQDLLSKSLYTFLAKFHISNKSILFKICISSDSRYKLINETDYLIFQRHLPVWEGSYNYQEDQVITSSIFTYQQC